MSLPFPFSLIRLSQSKHYESARTPQVRIFNCDDIIPEQTIRQLCSARAIMNK